MASLQHNIWPVNFYIYYTIPDVKTYTRKALDIAWKLQIDLSEPYQRNQRVVTSLCQATLSNVSV
jgi:hypothetical protein